MDISDVQSSAKSSSSDFSIERILSDDRRSTQVADTPGWLCCTRYRPPRLPRSARGSRARRSGRHARVPFSAGQAAALEAAYRRAPYLAPPALRALAAALQLRDDRIKIWFQNRRARERREKCALITPPQPMALAPSYQQINMSQRNYLTNNDSPPRSQSAFPIRNADVEAQNSVNQSSNSDVVANVHRFGSIEWFTDEQEVDSDSHDDHSDGPLDIETIED